MTEWMTWKTPRPKVIGSLVESRAAVPGTVKYHQCWQGCECHRAYAVVSRCRGCGCCFHECQAVEDDDDAGDARASVGCLARLMPCVRASCRGAESKSTSWRLLTVSTSSMPWSRVQTYFARLLTLVRARCREAEFKVASLCCWS